ncbi:hypothetical protein [Trichothermofontia sp.]
MVSRYLRAAYGYACGVVQRYAFGVVPQLGRLPQWAGTWLARMSLLGISLLLGGWFATARATVPPHVHPNARPTVIAQALSPLEIQQSPQRSWESLPAIGTVDPTPAPYRLGEELYLETCQGCHVAVPPAVLPTETWRQLLQDPQHYGQQLTPLVGPARLLVWNYLLLSSRPHAADESIPFRVQESRYFKALHPDVPLQRPITLAGCVTCHPGAPQYDYRRLMADWMSR